ncbi:hypothetical protein PR048_031380 [Dryococelus australis]|uniref:Uncharacterized protein n=1 Tax=Dryococelus australis TaxID=614101 RepID=A0ABQ9G537_9NEOP|nr:hypothetical protein PR048_031380 [Dryococelus australis]
MYVPDFRLSSFYCRSGGIFWNEKLSSSSAKCEVIVDELYSDCLVPEMPARLREQEAGRNLARRRVRSCAMLHQSQVITRRVRNHWTNQPPPAAPPPLFPRTLASETGAGKKEVYTVASSPHARGFRNRLSRRCEGHILLSRWTSILQGSALAERSFRTMMLDGGFSRGSPVSLPPLHSGAAPYSLHFTLIGSRDLDVMSRQMSSLTRIRLSSVRSAVTVTPETLHAFARRSDETLGVRVSVARIAPSLLDLGRAATYQFERGLNLGQDRLGYDVIADSCPATGRWLLPSAGSPFRHSVTRVLEERCYTRLVSKRKRSAARIMHLRREMQGVAVNLISLIDISDSSLESYCPHFCVHTFLPAIHINAASIYRVVEDVGGGVFGCRGLLQTEDETALERSLTKAGLILLLGKGWGRKTEDETALERSLTKAGLILLLGKGWGRKRPEEFEDSFWDKLEFKTRAFTLVIGPEDVCHFLENAGPIVAFHYDSRRPMTPEFHENISAYAIFQYPAGVPAVLLSLFAACLCEKTFLDLNGQSGVVACGDVLRGKLVLAQYCTFSVHAAGASEHSVAYGNRRDPYLSQESSNGTITRVLWLQLPGYVEIDESRLHREFKTHTGQQHGGTLFASQHLFHTKIHPDHTPRIMPFGECQAASVRSETTVPFASEIEIRFVIGKYCGEEKKKKNTPRSGTDAAVQSYPGSPPISRFPFFPLSFTVVPSFRVRRAVGGNSACPRPGSYKGDEATRIGCPVAPKRNPLSRSRCDGFFDEGLESIDYSREVSVEQRWNARAWETGDPRENPPTSDVVRHDVRKSGSDPSGNRTRFASRRNYNPQLRIISVGNWRSKSCREEIWRDLAGRLKTLALGTTLVAEKLNPFVAKLLQRL